MLRKIIELSQLCNQTRFGEKTISWEIYARIYSAYLSNNNWITTDRAMNLVHAKTMIPVTENNWNFTVTNRKEAEKSWDPAGNVRKMMRNGSSIPTGKFSDFSGDLRAFSAGKNGKLARNQWKKSEDFPAGILLPCSADFQGFPACRNRPVLLDLGLKKKPYECPIKWLT